MIVKRTEVEGLGIIAQSIGNLCDNVVDLKGRLISPRDEAHARIMMYGREEIGKTDGTRVAMIVNFFSGELSVLQRMPKFPRSLAKSFMEASSQNKYFSTGSAKEYELVRKLADKEVKRGIAPEERKAIACP